MTRKTTQEVHKGNPPAAATVVRYSRHDMSVQGYDAQGVKVGEAIVCETLAAARRLRRDKNAALKASDASAGDAVVISAEASRPATPPS